MGDLELDGKLSGLKQEFIIYLLTELVKKKEKTIQRNFTFYELVSKITSNH